MWTSRRSQKYPRLSAKSIPNHLQITQNFVTLFPQTLVLDVINEWSLKYNKTKVFLKYLLYLYFELPEYWENEGKVWVKNYFCYLMSSCTSWIVDLSNYSLLKCRKLRHKQKDVPDYLLFKHFLNILLLTVYLYIKGELNQKTIFSQNMFYQKQSSRGAL